MKRRQSLTVTAPLNAQRVDKGENGEFARPIHEVIEELQKDRAGARDLLVQEPEKFQMELLSGGDKPRYGLRIKDQVVPFSQGGLDSLCRLLRMDFDYFSKFPRKEEFIEHAKTLLPGYMRKHQGCVIRLAGQANQVVRGVVGGNYTIMDDEQLLQMLGNIANTTLKDVKGVVVTSDRWNGSIYRMVFGDSVLKRDEIFPSLTIRNSEVGGNLKVDFGTFRVLCLNGSIGEGSKVSKVLNWGHTGNFDTQVLKVGQALRTATDRCTPLVHAIRTSAEKELRYPGEEINRLLRAGWIGHSFADNAAGVLAASITQGQKFGSVSPKSKYAVFNALTAAAKVYRPSEQARYEAVAQDYLFAN